MVLATITLSWCLVGQVAVAAEPGRGIAAHTSSTASAKDAVASDSLGPWPWVFFGTALATGVAGAGFLASSGSARSELEADLHSHEAFSRLDRRVFGHGLIGGFFVCVAVTALVAGMISLFWTEPDLYIAGEIVDGPGQATSRWMGY